MLVPIVALMMVGQPAPAPPAPRPAAPAVAEAPGKRSEAYFEFLRGRHLEGEGDVDGAVAAYRRAVSLDPASAEIQAELAALYARQNRADEAIAAAEAALGADPDNAEAHWVLGTVYAALAQGNTDGPPTVPDALDKAVLHLEKARPTRRYDLGLSLALGRLYLRQNDYAKAIEQLKWLSDQEPGAAEVAFLLAQAYEGAGQRAEALSTLRRVVEIEPRFFRAWVTLADLLERERRFDDAAEAYGHAIAQNTKSIELRTRQATALLNAGKTAAARDLLRDTVRDAPTDAGALYLLSEAERQLHNLDEAEATAKRLVALEPAQVRGAYALALVYDARREHQKVIDTLGPFAGGAGTTTTRPAMVQVRLGFAYQELGQYDRAIQSFEAARAAGGSDPAFDAYLAQALIEAGQAPRALEITAAARKTRPDDLRFVRLEADALARSGQLDAAIALLEAQARQHEDRAELPLTLAALCTEHDRFDRADAILAHAEKRFPQNVLVAFQRGAMLERQERYAEAEQAFRHALTLDPLHGPTLNYLGYMLAERGEQLDVAVSMLQRALQTDPYNGSYLDSLGWAHFMRGDLDQARRYLSMAVERLPRNSVVQDHWGDLLFKQGDRDAAVAAWERALAGDRESIDASAITRKIEAARRARP